MERGREGEMEGREEGKERERGREGEREGAREGGREGGRERGMEGWRKGRQWREREREGRGRQAYPNVPALTGSRGLEGLKLERYPHMLIGLDEERGRASQTFIGDHIIVHC